MGLYEYEKEYYTDSRWNSMSFERWLVKTYPKFGPIDDLKKEKKSVVFKHACKENETLAREMIQSRVVVSKSWVKLVYQYGSDDLVCLIPFNYHFLIQFDRWNLIENFQPKDFLTAIQYCKTDLIKRLINLKITCAVPLRCILNILDNLEVFKLVWPYYDGNYKIVFLNAIRSKSPVVNYLLDQVDLPELDLDDLYLCLECNFDLDHPKFKDLVIKHLGKLFDFAIHIANHTFIKYFQSFNIPIDVNMHTLLKLIRENAIDLIILPILRDSVKKYIVEMFECAFACGRGNVIDYLLPFDPVCTQDYIRLLIQRKKWAILNFHAQRHCLKDLVQNPNEFVENDALMVRNMFT